MNRINTRVWIAMIVAIVVMSAGCAKDPQVAVTPFVLVAPQESQLLPDADAGSRQSLEQSASMDGASQADE